MSNKCLAIFTLERFMEANETNFRGWTPVAELKNLYGGDKQTLYFSAQENILAIMFKYSNFEMQCSEENAISLTQLMLHKTLLVEFCEETRTFACVGYQASPEDHQRALEVVMDDTISTTKLRYCEHIYNYSICHDVMEMDYADGRKAFFNISEQIDEKERLYQKMRQRVPVESRMQPAEVIYRGDKEMFGRVQGGSMFLLRTGRNSWELVNAWVFKDRMGKLMDLNRELNDMKDDIHIMMNVANGK